MNLKLKFLIIFSVAAFSALSFFGYVAFDTAAQQNQLNERETLYEVFKRDISKVTAAVMQNNDIETTITKLEHSNLLSFLVYDSAYNTIYQSTSFPAITQKVRLSLPLISDKGEIAYNETEYHWFTQNVPNSPIMVAAFYAETREQQDSFFSQMAVTLAITAFMVLWASAWSAIYIGSLFERLNCQKEKLEKLATHDNLTSLPNRMLLNDRIDQAILRASREQSQFAVCFMDLNKFKIVNDTLGHKYGDILLQEVAIRLQQILRKSDTIARLGGDEFAFIFNNIDKSGCEIAINKALDEIEKPISLDEKPYVVSASVGIAIYPLHGENIDELLRHSDDAMYIAKKSGCRFHHYEEQQLNDTDKSSDFQPSIHPLN